MTSDDEVREILISDSVNINPLPAFTLSQLTQVDKILAVLWAKYPKHKEHFDDMHVLYKAIDVGLNMLEKGQLK